MGGGGGQPDSDMEVDFGEIGKIGISGFVNPNFRFLVNFGEIGSEKILEFPIFT